MSLYILLNLFVGLFFFFFASLINKCEPFSVFFKNYFIYWLCGSSLLLGLFSSCGEREPLTSFDA